MRKWPQEEPPGILWCGCEHSWRKSQERRTEAAGSSHGEAQGGTDVREASLLGWREDASTEWSQDKAGAQPGQQCTKLEGRRGCGAQWSWETFLWGGV